jgi:hypothetical protein
MVVLGRRRNEAVELANLVTPTLGHGIGVHATGHARRRRLLVEWQRPVSKIERLDRHVAAL